MIDLKSIFFNFLFNSSAYMLKELVVDGESYYLNIWDTAGQERVRYLSFGLHFQVLKALYPFGSYSKCILA